MQINKSTLITASIWNTDIVDNLTAIWVGTTAGDMDYYSSSTAKTRLAVGTKGYGLLSNGTIPAWSPGVTIIHHDTSDIVLQTSDYPTTDAVLYSYVLPANTLPANGALYISGFITLTGGNNGFYNVLSFGSSNSSDGAIIGLTAGTATGTEYFHAAIIAKGSTSAQRTIGWYSTPSTYPAASYVDSTVDSTTDVTIRIMYGWTGGLNAGDTITFHNMLIYYVPYYTT